MFSDPITVTVATVAKTLPRVTPDSGMQSTYALSDGTYAVSFGHTKTSRGRKVDTIRSVSNKIAADPFMTGVNKSVSSTVRLVVDSPLQGYTVAELADQVKALADFLTASTNANSIKLLGGEY